jgi:hypothetical protein
MNENPHPKPTEEQPLATIRQYTEQDPAYIIEKSQHGGIPASSAEDRRMTLSAWITLILLMLLALVWAGTKLVLAFFHHLFMSPTCCRRNKSYDNIH